MSMALVSVHAAGGVVDNWQTSTTAVKNCMTVPSISGCLFRDRIGAVNGLSR
jgi:hypothetical protein